LAFHPEWLYCSYEEAVLYTDRTVKRLAEGLALCDVDRMRAQMARASRSTKRSSTRKVKEMLRGRVGEEEKRALIGRWKQTVSDEEERVAMRVLEVLELDVYRSGCLEPVLNATEGG
jgi:hypothetical protein